jgi:hypothetical protein
MPFWGDGVVRAFAGDGVAGDRHGRAIDGGDAVLLVVADGVAADRAAGGVGVVDRVAVLAAVERHLTDVVDVAAGDVHGCSVCDDTEVVSA